VDDRYFTAIFSSGKHKVLGKKLQPFTLSHRLALLALDSPLSGECKRDSTTFAELQIAIEICRQKGGANINLNVKPSLGFNGMKYLKGYFERQMYLFGQYIREYSSQPKLWQAKSNDEDTDSNDLLNPHWTLNVITGLMTMAGMSYGEAMATEEGKAIWLYIGLLRHKGTDIKIKSTDFEKWVKEMELQAQKDGN